VTRIAYLFLLGAALSACDGAIGGGKSPTFTIAVKWTLDRADYGFTYTGKGEVTGGDTLSAYLVALEMRRTKRLDPSVPPDTVNYVDIMTRGRMPFTVTEYASRCTQYTTSKCLRDPAEPEITIRVVAWAPMTAVNP
jgi:hypothetical protein